MAKVKLSLTASPTFKSTVGIPVPGAKAVPVEFTFKGRSRDAFKEFVDGLGNRDDVDVILDVASGWDLEDPFNKESITALVDNYLGSARAVLEKYFAELTQARQGN